MTTCIDPYYWSKKKKLKSRYFTKKFRYDVTKFYGKRNINVINLKTDLKKQVLEF